MKLINDLYTPDIAFMPIGDCLGMGPKEAAYATKNFLTNIHTVIPMHFGTFPVLTGTPDEFRNQLKE
jgi:L-ascorbate metabolism protein UlaG (beta-lactamase superfamily)